MASSSSSFDGPSGFGHYDADSDPDLRSLVTMPVAKLGNEFQNNEIASLLQEQFVTDLGKASTAIVREENVKTSFAVWAALAWDLHMLIGSLRQSRKIPFTTIATALDLYRRCMRYERTVGQLPDDESELAGAENDAKYLRTFSARERTVWLFASFLLATKVEETLISFTLFKKVLQEKYRVPEEHAKMINDIVLREQHILAILGFDIVVHMPHIQLLKMSSQAIYLQIPDYIRDLALHYLNVSIFTGVMSVYQPVSIVVTAVYHAVQDRRVLLPEDDPLVSRNWWEEFHVPLEEIRDISLQIVPAMNALLNAGRSVPEVPAEGSGSSCVPQSRRTTVPCRRIDTFRKIQRINKGTFGTVWKAEDVNDPGKPIAVKKLHSTFPPDGHGGFPYYMLREILYLIRLNHTHIIHGSAMAVKKVSPPTFYIIMEFVEWDLLRLLQTQLQLEKTTPNNYRFSLAEVKSLLLQLLEAITYMHDMNLLHRDLKCANLLLTNEGVLKVADLGSIRDADRHTLSMTVQVITLWYRPPELICESPTYSAAVDIWSIGCLFYELLTYRPLFGGSTEEETMCKIIRAKGAPPRDVWDRLYSRLPAISNPGISKALRTYPEIRPLNRCVSHLTPEGANLFCSMLEWDPEKRITAKAALSHPFFTQEPLPKTPIPHPDVIAAARKSLANNQ